MTSQHQPVLSEGNLSLRPLTDDDWPLLLKWEGDPEVVHWFGGAIFSADQGSEEDHLRAVKEHFTQIRQTGHLWIIQCTQKSIGWCTLVRGPGDKQVYSDFAARDCRSIEISIGEKDCWGQGIGSTTNRLVTAFAFEQDGAEVACVCDVADYNRRSLRIFEKNGFEVYTTLSTPPGDRAQHLYYLILTRSMFEDYKSKGTERSEMI